MPSPITAAEFLSCVRRSGVADSAQLDAALADIRATSALPGEAKQLAEALIKNGVLTFFQAGQLLRGKWKGFFLGKYLILERLGAGGMGIVYLGEHKFLRRRVAIKVLPLALAQDRWFLEQFYQEARAVAALDHPNIVRAHDVDQDSGLHFLVMEFVDGASLQEIVTKHGSLDVLRAAHYIRQAALGLQHAHEVGLVHRDIKPGNLLLSRQGLVKILDLGLARLFRDSHLEGQSAGSETRMVGTEDYLAPEQIVDSDRVDIRADIYSLGATFYFLLTGSAPFDDVKPDLHKLIRHVTRRPRPIVELRPETPQGLADIVNRMVSKNPWERFQTPGAVVQALTVWTRTPILAPPDTEMPELSLAAQRSGMEGSLSSAVRKGSKSSWVICGVTPISQSTAPTNSESTPSDPKAPTRVASSAPGRDSGRRSPPA
jgi:serine/threonine protein kinase